MKINKRLKTISQYVDKSSNVIDVGCDHAKLPIYLVLNNLCSSVIASDINEKPLEQAKVNIDFYKLNDEIQIKLGDGISTIDETVDTIIISGMGGKNIVDILEDGKNKLKNVKRIILSPNNNCDLVREYLKNINFKIIKEQIVCEKSKFYNIMILEKGNIDYSEFELLFGYNVLKDDFYIRYCNYMIEKYENNLEKLPSKYIDDRNKLQKYIKFYKDEIL